MVRWLDFAGRETLRSWGVEVDATGEASVLASAPEITAAIADRIPAEHMAFFRETALVRCAGCYLFVHAWLRPGMSLDAQEPVDVLTIQKPFHGFDGDLGVVVVHGHTPSPEPVIRPNRVCIDTKAYALGRLTCLVMKGEERWFLSDTSKNTVWSGVGTVLDLLGSPFSGSAAVIAASKRPTMPTTGALALIRGQSAPRSR